MRRRGSDESVKGRQAEECHKRKGGGQRGGNAGQGDQRKRPKIQAGVGLRKPRRGPQAGRRCKPALQLHAAAGAYAATICACSFCAATAPDPCRAGRTRATEGAGWGRRRPSPPTTPCTHTEVRRGGGGGGGVVSCSQQLPAQRRRRSWGRGSVLGMPATEQPRRCAAAPRGLRQASPTVRRCSPSPQPHPQAARPAVAHVI